MIINDNSQTRILDKTHSQGQSEIRYIHDVLGYNYRMTNVQAAILYGQLEIHEKILNKKKKIFNRYKKNLKVNKNIAFQYKEKDCENALWMFSIRVIGNTDYESAKQYFLSKGIETRNMFYPMSRHEHLKQYANLEKEIEAEQLLKEIIIFPSSPTLKSEEVDYISSEILNYCK